MFDRLFASFSLDTGSPRIAGISLRVRDLSTSVEFYETVLGCRKSSHQPSSHRACRLTFDREESRISESIELRAGRPLDARSALDHFSIEVSSEEDVDALHERARLMHARTTAPRNEEGSRLCVVFDPDGHKIEVFHPFDHDES